MVLIEPSFLGVGIPWGDYGLESASLGVGIPAQAHSCDGRASQRRIQKFRKGGALTIGVGRIIYYCTERSVESMMIK